jgi:hypothetical protein
MNASLVIEEFDDRTWYNRFSIWKNRFITKAKQMISDEELIKKVICEKNNVNTYYAKYNPKDI